MAFNFNLHFYGNVNFWSPFPAWELYCTPFLWARGNGKYWDMFWEYLHLLCLTDFMYIDVCMLYRVFQCNILVFQCLFVCVSRSSGLMTGWCSLKLYEIGKTNLRNVFTQINVFKFNFQVAHGLWVREKGENMIFGIICHSNYIVIFENHVVASGCL